MVDAWLVRAGRAGERDLWALDHGLVGGGFHEVPDLTEVGSRGEVAAAVHKGFPGASAGKIGNFTSQLWAFRGRIQVGDLVVLPVKTSRTLAIGKVTSGYLYRDDADPSRRHAREVEWLVTDLPRTLVKQDLLHSLGAFMTICGLTRHDAARRIAALAAGSGDPGSSVPLAPSPSSGVSAVEAEADDTSTSEMDVEQYALDRLSAYVIENFAGHRMQDLVAALLEAEGFTCTVPPHGPDGGVDVLAGTGVLGLDAPRVVVQVKSESGRVGAPVVSQLMGAMSTYQADQGLLVAWGGITKQAEQLLAQQYFRVRVWTAQDLLEALFRNYERVSEEIRSEIPLKRVWSLVEEAG